MADDTLLTLTADIVAAHVSNNRVADIDLPTLISNVYGSLSALGQSRAIETSAPAKREPIVSVRSSVKPDSVTCLICGKKQKTLKRHLAFTHKMAPAEYRAEFELKSDYPLTAPNYTEHRRNLAKSIGLGTKGRKLPDRNSRVSKTKT